MEFSTSNDRLGSSAGKSVSIVVPTYKEVENLRPLVERVSAAMKSAGRAYEMIVVDDDSRDGSDKVMADLASEGFPIRLITRVNERGLSSAVIAGFGQARGDILVCMDADLSHPPESLPQLVAALDDPAAEFVIGSRYVPGGGTEEGWGLFRWLNSKVATLLARPFTSARDPMAGFFALPRPIFQRASKLSPVGYKIGLELIVKCNCRNVREIPIHFVNRKFGQSKLSLREQINYIKHLKRLADFKFGWFSQLMQFSFVGATGAVVDLVGYMLLMDFAVRHFDSAILALLPAGGILARHHAGAALGLARGIAIWIAMTWNFYCNRRLTFSHSRGLPGTFRQYWQFVVACSLGAVINWLVSVALPNRFVFFDNHKLAAAVVGILAGLVFNFIMSRHWVFRHKHRQTGA